jgi:Trypsin
LPKNWLLTKVRLGEWDKNTNPDCQEINKVYYCAYDVVEIGILKIYAHESYDHTSANKFNDIAVIELEFPVKFNEFIRPICLPTNDTVEYFDYGSATVTGFGKTESGKNSQRLLKAEIDVVDRESCKRKYRVQGVTIHETQICAMKYYVDTW